MAYSTVEDLKAIIPEQHLINLTNDSALASEINTIKINDAIEYADELINSYLRNKYVLPLKFIPQIIVQLSSDIAVYRLYSRRPQELPKHIQTNYDEAKKILEKIQKEQILLDLPSEHPNQEVTKSANMIKTNKTASSKMFSDSFLKGFKI